ncbi:hypothetical protein IMG5_009390 [Ichthyophthirius multifiliis]|uniref:Uncharacterized protein n=1 Tax=Ichthyophthirius multifiliis TaxID=5932 RepID=G0QJV2_ICHMU|nr:hypothetical protein IMG5_009390 [Ichthyophthirius multifiliis]EGR34503.1 hypothetical protein IMG5_009390 [Ichthyophthirius multifiliis]|eukprot:XP_004039807.1 hypothetical protein IMG5_009390 [Ichthyophthirius multifiliis]
MSNNYYNQQWKQAIKELTLQMNLEMYPFDENVQEKGLKYKRSDLEWFNYYANLYIKYIDCYRKLENCYDQMLNPQKRILLKELLDNTTLRMIQVKQNIIYYNTHTLSIRSEYPNLDEVLKQNKLTPQALHIPIPRHMVEENQEERNKRNQLIEKLMMNYHETTAAEEEQFVDNATFFDNNIQHAICCIQKNERGRQGIERALIAKTLRKQDLYRKEKQNKLKQGHEIEEETEREQAVLVIQKYYKGFKGREQIYFMRQDELEFLGIFKKDKDFNNIYSDEFKEISYRNEMKKKQVEQEKGYKEALENIKGDYLEFWGDEIRDKMLQERREWIHDFLIKREFKGLPKKANEFYDKDKVAMPLTPEEEELQRVLEEQAKKEKKKEKEAKKAGKKKKKKLLRKR